MKPSPQFRNRHIFLILTAGLLVFFKDAQTSGLNCSEALSRKDLRITRPSFRQAGIFLLKKNIQSPIRKSRDDCPESETSGRTALASGTRLPLWEGGLSENEHYSKNPPMQEP